MERDLIGYNDQIPNIQWPNQGMIAVNFVLNYEEGSELNILDGDGQSESYLTDLADVVPLKGERHLSVESLFEYGSRVGIWRLLHLFEDYQIPLTLFMTGMALERNEALAKYLATHSHEIAGHGYRWINYRSVDEDVERKHIRQTIEGIEKLTNKTVTGWYTGRRSIHTRKLIVEAGIRYDSDSYADDLPYWVHVSGRKHLIIPYALDTNDARYAVTPGWSTGEDFFQYLKAAFDQLYCEGNHHPKMMTIGIHARLSGRPGRCHTLRRFIEYIQSKEKVWICRRNEIADYWYSNEASS